MNTNPPKVFHFDGKYLIQLPSTPNSGLYKFKNLDDGETYLYELQEIPEHYREEVRDASNQFQTRPRCAEKIRRSFGKRREINF